MIGVQLLLLHEEFLNKGMDNKQVVQFIRTMGIAYLLLIANFWHLVIGGLHWFWSNFHSLQLAMFYGLEECIP